MKTTMQGGDAAVATFSRLRAGDVMQTELVTVHASDPLRLVESTLLDAGISSVPVLDDNGQVLGLVSMRDVVSRYAVAHDLPADADENVLDDDIDADEEVAFTRLEHEPCAGDAMHTEFLSVGPETSLPSVAQRMVELRAHRALVVRQRRLLGLVSTMDLLRVMSAPSPAMA